MSTYFMEARTAHFSTKVFGPFFSSTATRSILGSASGIGVDVDSTGGITSDSSNQPTVIDASGGGSITIGSGSAGAIELDAGGSGITIGGSSADAVVLGGGGGSVTITGASTTIEGGTVTLGGNGTTAVEIGSHATDSIAIGAATNTLTFGTHLTTASGVNVGSSGARFGTMYANVIDATTITAQSMSYQNQVMGWKTTLLKDESGTERITGSPMACKVFELDLADLYSDNYFLSAGSDTYYYTLKWDDPRDTDLARERVGCLSAHAQVYQMFVTLVTPMTGAPDGAVWNLVHAPKSDGADPLTVASTSNSGGFVQLAVSSTTGLSVGDELVLTGFTTSDWNTICRVTSFVANTSILTDITHGAGSSSNGTATFKSQLSTFKTDIVGASAVSIALTDKRMDDTGMNDTVAGSTAMIHGAMPVPATLDAAPDHLLALKLVSTSPATTGKLRVFVMNVSFGATT